MKKYCKCSKCGRIRCRVYKTKSGKYANYLYSPKIKPCDKHDWVKIIPQLEEKIEWF